MFIEGISPQYAFVGELVDPPDLGSGIERCESSSLSEGTIKLIEYPLIKFNGYIYL